MVTKLCYGASCNSYVVGQEGGPCLVVDPGDPSGALARYVKKHHSECLAILLTHGHFDHIGGLETFSGSIPIYLSPFDEICLESPKYNGSHSLLGEGRKVHAANVREVGDLEELAFGDIKVKAIHTPFHTKGSTCYLLEGENALLSGDTLFHLSVGRTDLPGGEEKAMEGSLAKLASLPDGTKVLPGHGENTTIGNEKRYNPFLSFLKRNG